MSKNSQINQSIIIALKEANVLSEISNGHFTLNKDLISKINKFIHQGRGFLELRRAFKIIISKY